MLKCAFSENRSVSKYDYIIVCSKASWAGLTSWIALNNTAVASDCQTLSGQIPGDLPEEEIHGYGGKDFEERRVIRREWGIHLFVVHKLIQQLLCISYC